MVRALLDGRKTQTRRVVRPQPPEDYVFLGLYAPGLSPTFEDTSYEAREDFQSTQVYRPNDRLWVREAWSGCHVFRETPPSKRESFIGDGVPYAREEIWYWADGSPEYGDWEKPRPSIHMPRWASRLTLTVTGVRVRRIQDISKQDVEDEGIAPADRSQWAHYCYGPECPTDNSRNCGKHGCWGVREEFMDLWNSLNEKRGYGWSKNPWVVAYTFSVQHGNIDRL